MSGFCLKYPDVKTSLCVPVYTGRHSYLLR